MYILLLNYMLQLWVLLQVKSHVVDFDFSVVYVRILGFVMGITNGVYCSQNTLIISVDVKDGACYVEKKMFS